VGLRRRVPPSRPGVRRLHPAHPAISKTSEDARWPQPGTLVIVRFARATRSTA
jgi:hypothetical protein